MKQGMVVNSSFGRKGVAMTIVLIVVTQLFRIDDSQHLCLLFSIVCLACVGIVPLRKFSKLDVAVSLITGYELFSLLWAECPKASLGVAFYSMLNLNTYFIVRKLSSYDDAKHIIIGGICIAFLAALFLGIWSFYVFARSAYTSGFKDLYHLRFLFTPLGYQVNVWAELLIVMLGWGCLSRKFYYLLFFICILSVLLTFSRGGYISLIIYLCFIVVFTRDNAKKKGMVVSFFIAVALIMGIFHNEMTTTLRMDKTISQRYSAESRMTATSAAFESFMKRPVVGFGSNNFTYAVDSLLYQDSRKAFSSIAPNIVSQFIVEKGILGTGIYCFFFVTLLVFLWKNKERNDCRIMICLLMALVIKEIGQATMLHCTVTMTIMYILLGLLQITFEKSAQNKKLVFILASISVVCLVLWNFPNAFIYKIDDTAFRVKNALSLMDEYKRTGKKQFLFIAKEDLHKSLEKHQEDVSIKYLVANIAMLQGNDKIANNILHELSTFYPNNAMILLKMSELQYQEGKKDLSMEFFCKAVTIMPKLLKSKAIYKWEIKDKYFYMQLKKKIKELKPPVNASPAELARYGYIAIWCNNPKGYIYLNQAITQMPSLATPWKFLGDFKRYNLLTKGAFQKIYSMQDEREEPSVMLTDKQIFLYHYRTKFILWYGDDLK